MDIATDFEGIFSLAHILLLRDTRIIHVCLSELAFRFSPFVLFGFAYPNITWDSVRAAVSYTEYVPIHVL